LDTREKHHTGPTYLTTRIINSESDLSTDVDFTLLLGQLDLLGGFRSWAGAATVGDDILNPPKEGRVPVEIYLTMLGLIPFGVQNCIPRSVPVFP
jgi:hypothetical protein